MGELIVGDVFLIPKRGKQHKFKDWMTLSYHRRIQKKWDKLVRGQYDSLRITSNYLHTEIKLNNSIQVQPDYKAH